MQRIPESAPHIQALADAVQRTKWSVMIPVYNCSAYLPETLESVLLQDMGEDYMQIEVVDDCSTDTDVKALVKNFGKGRVAYYRQTENIGSLRNFETCVNRSRGHYVHLLHGDDKVKAGFYDTISSLFDQFPQSGAAFCAWEYINEKSEVLKTSKKEADRAGILENCLDTIAKGQMTQYASTVVKREVYEKLGSFYGVTYGEDWIMWARIAKEYPIVYTPQILAAYREHINSISGQGLLSGNNIKDIKKVSKIISGCLPADNQKEARKTIQRNYAYWMLEGTYTLWADTRNKQIVYSQLKQLLKGYLDSGLLKAMAKLWLLVLKA